MLSEWLAVSAGARDEQHYRESVLEGAQQAESSYEARALPAPLAMGSGASESLFKEIVPGEVKRKRGRPSKVVLDLLKSQGVVSTRYFGDEGEGCGSGAAHDVGSQQVPVSTVAVRPVRLEGPYLQTIQRGRMGLNELAMAVGGCLTCAAQANVLLDRKVETLANTYLNREDFVVASGVAMEKFFSMTGNAIQSRLTRLACSCFVVQHHERTLMESSLSKYLPQQDLLCYIDAGAYDETPMKVLLKDGTIMQMPGKSSSDKVPALRGTNGSVLALSPKSQTMIAKILQTRSTYGYLIRDSTGCVAITGQSFIPLQSMASTKASVLHQCLGRNSMVSLAAERFLIKCRSITVDRGASNKRAEELLLSERGASWATSIFFCCIHGLAGCHNKSFEALMNRHVKGALHLSLSLRVVSCWTTFRKALMIEIMCKLKLCVGAPPSETLGYKKKMLSLFLDDSAQSLQACVRLVGLVNGDWSDHAVVEHWWGDRHGPMPDKDLIAQRVSGAIMDALACKKPALWPRHRWHGFKSSLAWLGLMEGVHGLLSGTYSRFVNMLGHGNTPILDEDDILLPGSMSGDPHVMAFYDCQGWVSQFEPVGQASSESVQGAGATAGDTDVSYSKLNAKDRAEALEWLHAQPQGHVMLMAITLNPLEKLMSQHLKLSGHVWEKHERAVIAKQMLGGQECKRVYRVEIAAHGSLEHAFMMDMKALVENEKSEQIWSIIPELNLTLEMRVLAFRLMSRIGACVEQMVASPHRQYPTKLFCLLQKPHLGRAFAREPQCLKDPWSVRLLQDFPDYEGEVFQGILRLQAILSVVDIACIESRHSSLRRHVFAKSVHTWTLKFTNLSSEWLLQCHRTAPSKSKKSTVRVSERKSISQTCLKTTPPKNVHMILMICNIHTGCFENFCCFRFLEPELHSHEMEYNCILFKHVHFFPTLCPNPQLEAKQPPIVQRKKKKHFGGRWRAFVRLYTMGRKGTPDMSEVSMAYSQGLVARDPLLVKAEVVGSLVAATMKLGKRQVAPFGIKTRDLKRQRDMLAASRALQSCVGGNVFELAQHILQTCTDPLDLSRALLMATRVSRQRSAQMREEEAADDAILDKFAHKLGAGKVQALSQRLPFFQREVLQVVPDPHLLVYDVTPVAEAKKGQLLCSYACANRCNWGKALDSLWSNMHETIDAPIDDVHVDQRATLQPSACAAAGVCVCSNTAGGPKLKAMHNHLLKIMKETFKTKERRQDLAEGFVCVRFMRTSMVGATSSSAGADEAAEFLFHVGLMSWKPYKPCFQCLQRVQDAPEHLGAEVVHVKVNMRAIYNVVSPCRKTLLEVTARAFDLKASKNDRFEFVTWFFG
eukprot:5894053-Amphidinium_carterae.1